MGTIANSLYGSKNNYTGTVNCSAWDARGRQIKGITALLKALEGELEETGFFFISNSVRRFHSK